MPVQGPANFDKILEEAAKKGDLMQASPERYAKMTTGEIFAMLDKLEKDELDKMKKKVSPKGRPRRTRSPLPQEGDEDDNIYKRSTTPPTPKEWYQDGVEGGGDGDGDGDGDGEGESSTPVRRSDSPDANTVGDHLKSYAYDAESLKELTEQLSELDGRVRDKLIVPETKNTLKTMELARLLEIWKARIELHKLTVLAGKHWNIETTRQSKVEKILEDSNTELNTYILSLKKAKFDNTFYKRLELFKRLSAWVVQQAQTKYNEWFKTLGERAKKGVKPVKITTSEMKKKQEKMFYERRDATFKLVLGDIPQDVERRRVKAMKRRAEKIKLQKNDKSAKYTKVMLAPKKGSPIPVFIAKPPVRKAAKSLPKKDPRYVNDAKKTRGTKARSTPPVRVTRKLNKQLDEEEMLQKSMKKRYFIMDKKLVFKVFGDFTAHTDKNSLPAALRFQNGIPVYSGKTVPKWNIKGSFIIDDSDNTLPVTHHYITLRGIKVGVNKLATVLRSESWDPCSRFNKEPVDCRTYLSVENEPYRCMASRSGGCTTAQLRVPEFYGKNVIKYNSVKPAWKWKPPAKFMQRWMEFMGGKLQAIYANGAGGVSNQFELVDAIEWAHEDLKQLKVSIENQEKLNVNEFKRIEIPPPFKPGDAPFKLNDGGYAKLSPDAQSLLSKVPQHYKYTETIEFSTVQSFDAPGMVTKKPSAETNKPSAGVNKQIRPRRRDPSETIKQTKRTKPDKLYLPKVHKRQVVRDYPDLRKANTTGKVLSVVKYKRGIYNNLRVITAIDVTNIMRQTYLEGFMCIKLNTVISSKIISDETRALAFDNNVDLRSISILNTAVETEIGKIKMIDVERAIKARRALKKDHSGPKLAELARLESDERKIDWYGSQLVKLIDLTKTMRKGNQQAHARKGHTVDDWEKNRPHIKRVLKDLKNLTENATSDKHKKQLKKILDDYERSYNIYTKFLQDQATVQKERTDRKQTDPNILWKSMLFD